MQCHGIWTCYNNCYFYTYIEVREFTLCISNSKSQREIIYEEKKIVMNSPCTMMETNIIND